MLMCEHLLQARKSKKLSQRALGKLVGVSGTVIGLYENGIRSPKADTLQRMAEILEVDAEWLASKGDAGPQGEEQRQLNSIMELVGLLEKPGTESRFLSSYARLNFALTELKRAVEERQDDVSGDCELESLRRIEMFAIACCNYFDDMQGRCPGGYAEVKERFGVWQREKQKFDGLLAEYLKLNPKGRKIIVHTATALAATPEYQRDMGEIAGADFDLKSAGRYFQHVREDAGLSLAAVGEQSGLSDGDIRLIEQGRRVPAAGEICRISYALGLRLTDFLPFAAEDAVLVNKMYDVLQGFLNQDDIAEASKQIVLNAHMQQLEKMAEKALLEINVRKAQEGASYYNKE